MSDLGSPVQSVSNSVPAPTQGASKPQAPFPPGQSSSTPAPLPLQAPAPTSASGVTDQNSPAPAPESAPIAPAPQLEVSQQLAPTQEAKTSLAPAPTAPAKSTVAPAALVQADNVAPAAPAAFKTEAVVAPAAVARNRPVAAPAMQATKAVAPAPRKALRHRIPAPTWQNLLYFKELKEITAAIGQVKQRLGIAGGQFAWSRVGDEPPIPLDSFGDLVKAVFGDPDQDFGAEALLSEAIAKLPIEVAALANAQKSSTLNLEGLWIEFSSTESPKLEIIVSIALPSSTENLGPFSLNRIYLTFGDRQRDLASRQKDNPAET